MDGVITRGANVSLIPSAGAGLRVLWQNEHYPDVIKGGGGAVNTYYIVRALERLGCDPVVLASGGIRDRTGWEAFDGTRIMRLASVRPPDRLWPIWPVLMPHALRQPLAEIARPFDAFVCSDSAYALSLGRLYPDRPLVCRVEGTVRGYDAAVPADRVGISRSPRELKLAVIHRLLTLENEVMDRRAWKRSHALVVKSAFMKRDVTRLYGITPEKIHVIPNGVDHERYARARPTEAALERLGNPERGTLVITFCGRLVKMKNVPHLLRAFARMRLRSRCLLALVGDGAEREALEAEAQRLGISSEVRFIGRTDRVEEFLAASDIFVLPSTYEPFGNALLEAMASGLPCVALRPDHAAIRTASDEIIEDGETGSLVDPHDPGALAATLDRLAADPALRRRLGEAGRARCRSAYSWDGCAAGYLELLSRTTAAGGR
jgi:glycosyltransferase involved in cell wall biosynthesis